MNRVVVEAKGLTKAYSEKSVVENINFDILEGETFGLLGPNGAGKSSTMKMMYCSAPLSRGELYILGLNVKNHSRKIKSKIGVVPQDDGLDPDFSVLDNLLVYASYFQIPQKIAERRAKELLKIMRLEDFAQSKVDTLSGGLRRRLVILRALINEPDILFLDEPTTGLDPQARIFIWEYLKKLKSLGTTIVLTTHYMEEAENLCDRIAVMDKGHILRIGTPQELIEEFIGKQVVEFKTNLREVAYYTGRLRAAQFNYQVIHDRIYAYLSEGQTTEEVVKIVVSDNIVIRKPSLNDVFLKLAGHELKEEER